MKNLKYSTVIWDWNGTLLNDVDWCVKCVNNMLAKREIKTFADKSQYHEVFGFPIIDYYKRAGFDFEKEPFSQLAEEYMAIYHSADKQNCPLHQNAEQVLVELHESGVKQIVLSASEKEHLLKQINLFNIKHYFDDILGIDNIYAASKAEIGKKYIQNSGVQKAVLIGDTLHDFDVAAEIGAACILIASGHQSKEKLQESGAVVVDEIADVLQLIL